MEKLKAANKKLEGDLSDARKEASAQADATSDVEKKLKEVCRALAWARGCVYARGWRGGVNRAAEEVGIMGEKG